MGAKKTRLNIPDFDPATHTYSVDGVKVPGFHEIAEAEGLIGYNGIRPEMLDWAKEKGTAVHAGCDLIDQGTLDWATVANEIKGYLEAYQKFKDDTGFTPEKIEQALYNPIYRYACKVDRIGHMVHDKRVLVYEIKTTATAMDSHIMQVVAQSLCLPDLPTVAYIIYLAKDGGVTLKEVKYDDFRKFQNVWLSAVTLYHFNEGGGFWELQRQNSESQRRWYHSRL